MIKQEAIQAMKEGKKVTHAYFDAEEWVTMEGDSVVMEDGHSCSSKEFWWYRDQYICFNEGWSIYKEEKEAEL